MSAASASTRLRERGNQYYGRASAGAEDRLSLLHVAKSLYEESLQLASSADERASTHKNLGATMVQLAGLSSTSASTRQLLLQSVHHKCQAYVEGPAAHKSEAWLETAWEAIDTSMDLVQEQLAMLLHASPANMGQALQQLAELHAVIPEEICEWRMYSSRDLLKEASNIAAQLIDTSGAAGAAGGAATGRRARYGAAPAEADWKGCLRLLAEANRPLIEALQLALDFEDGDEVTRLLTIEDELYVMECRACSTQARLQGEQLMQHTLRQRSDRLDKQAAAAAAAQQQQQQQHDSDATQQGRDQSKASTGAPEFGAHADAEAPADTSGATHQSRTYKKAKRQQHRQSQLRQQQQQQQQQKCSKIDAQDRTASEVPAHAADAAAAAEAAAAAAAAACERDGLLCVLDLLKSAAVLARERDLQAEAQAVSSLGHLYKVCAAILDPILVPHRAAGSAAAAAAGADRLLARSAEERSRDAFLRVLLLVDALPNKISLMMEDWYREARDSISEYQASRAAAEEQKREAERAPVREALREELQALYDAANRGWAELLKHCYSKHPPLNPANRLPPDAVFDADHGKELLRKAILAYHPDKQGSSGVAFSWQVLAEEITKQLTRKYECFK